jgi:nitrite reductase (NADH) small subunit
MTLHFVTLQDQLEDAKPTVFSVQGRSIGLIKSRGKIYAVRNVCPHKGAPVCKGTLRGTMLPSDPGAFVFGLDNQILQCPWHGWEFDLETGSGVCESRGHLVLYPVVLKEQSVYLDL